MSATQLLMAAAAGQPVQLPTELARKLLSCCNDGEVAEVLGLSLARRVRLRNDALLQAARILSTDGCTTWQAAQRLAQSVRRFERALLPALQAGQDIPLTPHESALWTAFQVRGTRMLRSPRKLYSMLLLD